MLGEHCQPIHIGLLAAMPEELGTILEKLNNIEEKVIGNLTIYTGQWENSEKQKILISAAWSGWGKVSAASATTKLCNHSYKNKIIDLILFTGVAGGIKENLRQWDIIIANSVIQYDMDARPLYEKFVIPSIRKDKIKPNLKQTKNLYESLSKKKSEGKLEKFGQVYLGLLGTGDRFILDKTSVNKLSLELPELLAVEMEGGAFAQVACQEKVNWFLLRVISDNANEVADNDFNLFLKQYKNESWKLIELFIKVLLSQ